MKKLFSIGGLVSTLPLSEQFGIAKEAGFDGVDYILQPKDLWIKPNKIYQMSKSFEMPIYGIHIPLLFVLIFPPFLYNRLLGSLELFPDMQILNLHVSCFLNPIQRNDKALKKFVALAAKKGINISFESNPSHGVLNHYPKETYNPEMFANFCIRNKLPMNIDTSHIATWNYDILKFFKKYHKFITVIHVSDYGNGMQHQPVGEGKLPLSALFQEMKQVSFNGTVIFELYRFSKNITKNKKISLIKNSLQQLNQSLH